MISLLLIVIYSPCSRQHPSGLVLALMRYRLPQTPQLSFGPTSFLSRLPTV